MKNQPIGSTCDDTVFYLDKHINKKNKEIRLKCIKKDKNVLIIDKHFFKDICQIIKDGLNKGEI